MKLSRLLFAAAVAIFLGACASNDDQQLSLAEAAAHLGVSRAFKRADENGDGMLSREEFRSVDRAGR